MRYLVRARVKPGCEKPLLEAIQRGTLGQGSVAEGEYLRNMREARQLAGQEVRWARFVIVRRRCKRKRPIGKSSSISSECRTRMTGASAATSMAVSPGLAATAIARLALRKNSAI